MTTSQKSALLLGLGLLSVFGIYEAMEARQRRVELARIKARQAAVRAARPSATIVPAPPPRAPSAESAPARTEATDAASVLEQRVALLKKLLGELPAQQLPEIRLLSAADWLEIVGKHALETSADIRVALADLRAVARKKFAGMLQDALRAYTTAWDGQLPNDIAQLASHLAAPADAEMLARYELVRSGKVGDPAEKLIREKKTSDMILSVGLDGWDLTNNAELPPAFGETSDDAVERAWRALGTALGDDAKAAMSSVPSPAVLGGLMQNAFEQLIPIYGTDDAFGDALKQAVKNFQAAHPDEALANLAQVLPYLAHADKFAETMRPTFAQLAYLREHPGQPPADAAALQPYLNRPFNPAESLQEMKLSTDGEHVSLNYSWGMQK